MQRQREAQAPGHGWGGAAVNPVDFLVQLWGPKPPRGVIQLWELERRRSHYLAAPAGAGGLQGQRDIYTAVSLAGRNYGRKHRARADQAVAIAGLWLDADVDGGPDAKTGAIPTQQDAAQLAQLIAEPTIVVNSGYGIHAWWLLDTPWAFTSAAEQTDAATMSAQWYALHRAEAAARGWGLDHTHDLARVLRLPGTINAKGGGDAPVTVLAAGGPRYEREAFAELAAAAGPVEVALHAGDADTGGALPDVMARGARINPARLDALRANIPEFDRSWVHGRGDAWSLSEYDLSIATYAAQAQWTDQEIADLIAHHRQLWAPTDRKAMRRDYLQRTVAKARHARDYADAATRAARLMSREAA